MQTLPLTMKPISRLGFRRAADVWRSLLNVFFKLALLFASVTARSIPSDDVVVRTGLGAIRGFEQYFDDTRLRVFLGVPYAKKPSGIRRFTKPVSLCQLVKYDQFVCRK